MSSPVPSKDSSKDISRKNFPEVADPQNVDSDSSSSSSEDDDYDPNEDGGAGVPETEYLGIEYVLFSKAFSVQFHVDSAMGLPVSSTATRVSAILITPDRKQIGDATLSSFSQPASDYMSPKYDLHMSWRKSELLPTVTILCRIDTLENPTLYPRCVGYAACKLCIDENGLQVNDQTMSQSNDGLLGLQSANIDANSSSSRGTSNDANHQVYVNSGHFLLPIVYGSVSELSTLTVAAVEAMPHIAGAFLSVKLRADSNSLDSVSRYMMRANSETGTENTEDALASISSTNYQSQYSILNPLCVTKVLVETFAGRSNQSLAKLPMSSALLSDILKNQKIYSGEKMMMHTYMKEWIRNSFPANIASITQFINFKTMFTYNDDVGALLALDMLHNMPARSNLIRAASESAAVQAMNSGLSRGWDGRISFFKTVFKYLPGDPVKAAEQKKQLQQEKQQKAESSAVSVAANSKDNKSSEEPARLVDALAAAASITSSASPATGIASTAATPGLEVKLTLSVGGGAAASVDAPDSATEKASPHPEDAAAAAAVAATSTAGSKINKSSNNNKPEEKPQHQQQQSVSAQIAVSVVTRAVGSALNNVGAMAILNQQTQGATGAAAVGTAVSILSRHSSSSSDVSSSTADLTTPLPNIVSSPPKSLQNKNNISTSTAAASGSGGASAGAVMMPTSSGINGRRPSRGSNLAVVLENVPQLNPTVVSSNNNIRRRSLRNGELPGDVIMSTNDITNALQSAGAGVSVSNNKQFNSNLRRRSMDNSAMAVGANGIRRRSLTNGNNAATLALSLGTATAITVSGGVTPSVNSGKDTLKPLPSDLNGTGVLRRRSIGGAANFSSAAAGTAGPNSLLDMQILDSPKPKPKSAFGNGAEGSPVKDSQGGLLTAITRRRSVGSVPTGAGLGAGLSPELKSKPSPASAWSTDNGSSTNTITSAGTSSNPISAVVSTLRRRSLGGGNMIVPVTSDSTGGVPNEAPAETPAAPIDLLSPAPSSHHRKHHHHHNRHSSGASQNSDNLSVESGQSGDTNRRRSLNNIRRRSLNNNLNYNNQLAAASESNSSQYKYLNSPLPPIKTQPASLYEETILENSNSGSSEEDSIKKPTRLLSPAPMRPISKSELITNAIDTFATNIRRNSLGKDKILLPDGFGASSNAASALSGKLGSDYQEDEDDIYDFGGTNASFLSPQRPSSGGNTGGSVISLALTSDNIKRNSLIENSLSNSAKLQSTLTAFNANIRRNSSGGGPAAAAAAALAASGGLTGGPPGVMTKARSNNDLMSDKISSHSKNSKGSARKYIYSGGRNIRGGGGGGVSAEIRNNSIFNIHNEYSYDPDTSGLLGGGLAGSLNPYGRRGSHSSMNSYVSDFSAQQKAAATNGKVTIIDDASLDLDLETSTEQFPVYLDEYSSTAGLGMSKCGAVLIVVTAVDILTANTSTNISVPTPGQEEPNYLINAHHVPFSPQHSFSSLQSDFSFLYRNAKHIKAEKLQGLVGIFIGHHDPNATWWGLLPLQVDSPFHSYVLALSGENTPNIAAAAAAGGGIGEAAQQQQLQQHLQNEVTVTALGVVNSGTHQIPLFAGVPPKEMEESPDPMEWVLQTMKAQNEMRAEHERQKKLTGSSLVGELCSSLSEAMGSPKSPKTKKSKKLKIKDELKLSDGASAIVRVVDARLLRFGCEPIAVNPHKTINMSHMETMLKASMLSNSSKESPEASATSGVGLLSVGSTGSTTLGDSFNPNNSTSGNSVVTTHTNSSGRMQDFLLPKSANRLIRSVRSGGRGSLRSSSLWSKHSIRKLLKKFQYSTASTRKNLIRNAQLNRNIKSAIPGMTDPDTLMSEVNQKFTLTLSDD